MCKNLAVFFGKKERC